MALPTAAGWWLISFTNADPQDMGLLSLIFNVAAAAHAPFISAASPKLFDMDGFNNLGNPRDLAKLFESSEMIKWRSFRESEDSRYVSLTLPHVLARLPYGPATVPVEEFNFVEDVDGRDYKKYLWSNAAYVLGQRVTNAFAHSASGPLLFAVWKAAVSCRGCPRTPSVRMKVTWL